MDEAIRSAVKSVNNLDAQLGDLICGWKVKEVSGALHTLLDLANSYLTASKVLPEEREVRFYPAIPKNEINGSPVGRENQEDIAFNICRSLMLPLIVEMDNKIKELEKELEKEVAGQLTWRNELNNDKIKLLKENEELRKRGDDWEKATDILLASKEQLQANLAEKERECKKLEEDMWIWVEKHNKVAEELYDLKEHSQSKPSLECEHNYEMIFTRERDTTAGNVVETRWRCKKCLAENTTYDTK